MPDIKYPSILIVYPNQFGYHTDSYKYCEYLQDSFNVSYICFDKGFERLDLPDVRVIYLPFNTGKIKRLVYFYYYLVQLTRKEKFDVIFTIQFKFCFIIGLFARAKIKILDYRTGDLNNNNKIRRLKNFSLRFDSFFFKHISIISEGLRDILGFRNTRTHILPLGADIISKKEKVFDRLDLLYVGTLSQRNIEQTIEGVALFMSEHKELSGSVSYKIIGFGTGQEEEKVRHTIKAMNLENTVSFLGRKKYTDLPEYFNTSNIGVSFVPITPYYEYQPVTKLFEYLLSGMVVIATNTYENRLIVSNKNGVLISDTPEEFYTGLVNIHTKRSSYSSSAIRKSAELHTWMNIVKTNLKPYLGRLISEKS